MSRGHFSFMRIRGFLRKESLQIRRDPSSILLGIVLPVVMLFLFGFGVSLDPKDVPVAFVGKTETEVTRNLLARFELSPYFQVNQVTSLHHAQVLMEQGKVDAIVHLHDDFNADFARAGRPQVQLIINGVDSNRGRLVQGYMEGTLSTFTASLAAQGNSVMAPPIHVESRMWFNESRDSTHFLVPGLLTIIMTLIGTLLTALVIAREWERGTMEAILATPLRPEEILIGKTVPYFILGMSGMALCVLLGVTLFGVPLRGSITLLFLTAGIFLLASMGLGLTISAITRLQFVAAMGGIISGFLPAFFLSGLLFDIDSTPAVVQAISRIIPARYFVNISQTLFLAGDVWAIILPSTGILIFMAVLLLIITRSKIKGRLPQ